MRTTIPRLALALLALAAKTSAASVDLGDGPGLSPNNLAIGGISTPLTGDSTIRGPGPGEGGFSSAMSLQGLLDSKGSPTTGLPGLTADSGTQGSMNGYLPRSEILPALPGGVLGDGQGRLSVDEADPGSAESGGPPILSAVPDPAKAILSTLGVGGALFAYRARRRKAAPGWGN